MKIGMVQIMLVVMVIFLAACQQEGAEETALSAESQSGNNGIVTTTHFVPLVSMAPSMSGSYAQIYLREKAPESAPASYQGQVVLFIHGSGTPAEVAFDVPYPGHSWMDYLAQRGMDVFAMDTTGYGRSTRPPVMNDRCNLSPEEQQDLFGDTCGPSYPYAATTLNSDWHDIDAVVNYLKELKGVETVHLVAWSLGGPRSIGYTLLHPENIGNIVLLAPAYRPDVPAAVTQSQLVGAAFTKQSRDDFDANWDRQVGCENQYDLAVSDAVWQAILESDPVGATWGAGVRRAPRTPMVGMSPTDVGSVNKSVLMIVGEHDAQVVPQRVRDFYADLGSENKVYVEMACSSHNAMWERHAEALFAASHEWLNSARFNDESSGMMNLP